MLYKGLLILASIVLFGIAERFFPAERGQPFQGRFRNVLYICFFLAAQWLTLLFAKDLSVLPSSTIEHPPIAYLMLNIFAILFVSDLIFYWYHRLQHQSRWLWPIHELHHSDAALNATSSMRSYWLEAPIQFLLITIPVGLLITRDTHILWILPILSTAWLFFTHANVRLSLGPLTPFLTGPQLHRIHHSILPAHRNKNFAQYFPFIDLLFGTYYRPEQKEFPKTGTNDLPTDAPFSISLPKPFRTWKTFFSKARPSS